MYLPNAKYVVDGSSMLIKHHCNKLLPRCRSPDYVQNNPDFSSWSCVTEMIPPVKLLAHFSPVAFTFAMSSYCSGLSEIFCTTYEILLFWLHYLKVQCSFNFISAWNLFNYKWFQLAVHGVMGCGKQSMLVWQYQHLLSMESWVVANNLC